ncbi:AAA domain-containing protein [Proteinivorax tanatarense]|uniref:AAA domain-containing protein n=1 Tax=Proteinivorax tanatarense TaxID=1260629 RepID=A0AAU7VMC6_9FIRM
MEKLITVGTVHRFQCRERKITILSTVYGSQEKCHFIDANKSMLNVAVSRAKDSYLVFGDINCLSKMKKKPVDC